MLFRFGWQVATTMQHPKTPERRKLPPTRPPSLLINARNVDFNPPIKSLDGRPNHVNSGVFLPNLDFLYSSYTRLGDFELAKQYLDTALDYYRRNDMRPYLARVLQSLTYWYEQQGRSAEAEQTRAEAQRLMEELSLPPVRSISSPRFR
jgi:tetratricopeptide (TPR) repeat protein